MTAALPDKYEAIQTRLMSSIPNANIDDINAFLSFALGSKSEIRIRYEEAAYQIAQMLGLTKFTARTLTPKNAEHLLAILEAFGARDWSNPANRQCVFVELTTPFASVGVAHFIRYYTQHGDGAESLQTLSTTDIPPRAMQATIVKTSAASIIAASGSTTPTANATNSNIVRNTLKELGFKSIKADAIISYLESRITDDKPKCAETLQKMLGIPGNFSKNKREIAWHILLTQSADTIRNPAALSAYLTQCLANPSDNPWAYPAYHQIIQQMISNLGDPTFCPAGPVKAGPKPSPSAPARNEIVPSPDTPPPPDAPHDLPTNSVIIPLVEDDRSPWRKAFEQRLARAAAANANRPIKPITPKSGYADIFINKFGFRHIADYTRQILQCADLILNQTIGDDPMDCILMAIMIMAKPEHDTVYLRKYLPEVFANTPNGNEYFIGRQNEITEAIIRDGFAMNINHAQRWCGTNKVEWRDFMAGALMAAHGAIAKHITETGIDLTNHPGLKWPEQPKNAPIISDGFQRYTMDKVAQALMGEIGWAKVKIDDTTPPVITLAAQATLSRGSM